MFATFMETSVHKGKQSKFSTRVKIQKILNLVMTETVCWEGEES